MFGQSGAADPDRAAAHAAEAARWAREEEEYELIMQRAEDQFEDDIERLHEISALEAAGILDSGELFYY